MFPRILFLVWSGLRLATSKLLMRTQKHKWSNSYLDSPKARHSGNSSIFLLAYYRHKADAPPRALQFLISFPPSAQLLGQICVYLCNKGASFYKMLETWGSEKLTQVPVHPCGLQLIPVFAHFRSIFSFWLPSLLMLGPPPVAETTALCKPYKQKEEALKRMA